MNPVSRCQPFLFLAALMLTIVGCSSGVKTPPLGDVRGTVLLDGQPLKEALVFFDPLEGGHSSTAVTDEQGRFQLRYIAQQSGAVVGPHQVRVNSATYAGEGADDPVLPATYNNNTELKATVVAGTNTINFDLLSTGKVSQVP